MYIQKIFIFVLIFRLKKYVSKVNNKKKMRGNNMQLTNEYLFYNCSIQLYIQKMLYKFQVKKIPSTKWPLKLHMQ